MMEQKPVAYAIITENGRAKMLRENVYPTMDGKHLLYTGLFTADQLKAEREKAIRECAAIAKSYDNDCYENYADVIFDKISALLSTNEEEPE